MMEHPPIPERHHGIAKHDLPRDVRSYVKNLEQQIRDQFRALGYHGPLTNIDEVETAVASLRTTTTPRDLPSITHLTTLSHALSEAYRTGTIPESEAPEGHLPYEAWSTDLNDFLHQNNLELKDGSTIEQCLEHQQDWYRSTYNDPNFTVDFRVLTMTPERLEDIKAAIERREVNHLLLVSPPRKETLTPDEISDPTLGDLPRTLTRVLFDRLIRNSNIKVWPRMNPTPDDFLNQLRDLTLRDLTRNTLPPEDPNYIPVPFDKDHWLEYLQALYPTLKCPAIIDPETHETPPPEVSFVAWEQHPPTDRLIPDPQNPATLTAETIQNKSQLDAVRLRYPIPTLSQYLVLFRQHYDAEGGAGHELDRTTWSWLFGVIDPQRFPDRPAVGVYWSTDGLGVRRNAPGIAGSTGRLRSVR